MGEGCSAALSRAAATGDEPAGTLPASASLASKLDTRLGTPLEVTSSTWRLAGAEVLELAVDGVAGSACSSQDTYHISTNTDITPTLFPTREHTQWHGSG